MILYFSGTGNSRYAARLLSQATGDALVSINDMLKSGIRRPLRSEKPFVFVAPTYAWRIPKVVEDFIRDAELSGSSKAYFIMTCGGDTGNAAKYLKKLCADKSLDYMGLTSVPMPENYIPIYQAPDEAQAARLISAAEPPLRSAAERIGSGQKLPGGHAGLLDFFKSGPVNWGFYKVFVSDKRFRTTDACISCGKCADLCPMNDIELVEGRPEWGGNCTQCMACICGCPKAAIEYGRLTKNKRRYYLDDAK